MHINGVIDKTFENNNTNRFYNQKRTNPNGINKEKNINDDDDEDEKFYSNILQTIKQDDIKHTDVGFKNIPKRKPCTPKKTHFNPSFTKEQPDNPPSPTTKNRHNNRDMWNRHDKASKTSHLNPRKLKKEDNGNNNMPSPFKNVLMIPGLNLNKESSTSNFTTQKRKSACSNLKNLCKMEQQEEIMNVKTKNFKEMDLNSNMNSSNQAIQLLPSERVVQQRMTIIADDKDNNNKKLEIKGNIQFEVFSDKLLPFPIDLLQIQKINSFEGYKQTKESESLLLLNELPPDRKPNKANDSNNNHSSNSNNIIIINQNGYNAYVEKTPSKKNKNLNQNKKKRMLFCCIPVK